MHMVKRKLWIKKINEGWKKRNIIWLSGVRRVGKTFLCRSLPDIEYFDCELPRVRRMMEDPEGFLNELQGKTVVLDEVHRLGNPSELLKIAADHYPGIKILATGSSSLGASKKFRDTLTGRKVEVWLTPMTLEDSEDFGNTDIRHRFLHGGLPPFFLSSEIPEREFQEWMDAYWAKDIQELFRLERRYSFLRFVELILARSGGIFEATRFAIPCEVSRTTISNYLTVLEATYIVNVIRPFSTHRPTEIVSAPKVYGFDTGFVCYYRGWYDLRQDDLGYLFEHLVLNELHAHLQTRKIQYWRDKQGHEIDFIILKKGNPCAIECKWSSEEFDPSNLKVFRRRYPEGENYVVCWDVQRTYTKAFGEILVRFVSIEGLVKRLLSQRKVD
ncbi:MAG TPA: ATP-binding protein [Nitrospirae bacterium]|nr:ATP-binding protein [Nitrospirota bacterium]